MSSLTQQVTGMSGIGAPREGHVAEKIDLGSYDVGAGSIRNGQSIQIPLGNSNVARQYLLGLCGGETDMFGVGFIEALEDDELCVLARLSYQWQMEVTNDRFIDYVLMLEGITGIKYNGELNEHGLRALDLLREEEIVEDDKEMSQRIRFLLKWAFERRETDASRLVVVYPFTEKYGEDRFEYVTGMYYDPQYFSKCRVTGKYVGWYDCEDGKHLTRFTWQKSMPTFCTLKADCRCSLCVSCTKTSETRRRFPQSMRDRFRNWVLSAAVHKWGKLRRRTTEKVRMLNKLATGKFVTSRDSTITFDDGTTITAEERAKLKKHVVFGYCASKWLRNHDQRSDDEKEETFTDKNPEFMFYKDEYIRLPKGFTPHTIQVHGCPKDITPQEIQTLVGQVTGVIDVKRPANTAGQPASVWEVVIPQKFGFREVYQVCHVLTGVPVTIRDKTLQFVDPLAEVVPTVQVTTPSHRGGGVDSDASQWENVGRPHGAHRSGHGGHGAHRSGHGQGGARGSDHPGGAHGSGRQGGARGGARR